ncbi:unnamed protein product, partial [Ectocarpus sp. 12 AP-2014]
SLLSLASLSPRRMRSSISIGGRGLSAWTLRGAVPARAAATAVDALTVEEGSTSQSPSPLPNSTGGGVVDFKRGLQHDRGAGGSPSPSAGPEGSTSSQTRGLKRLTRKLSFRQRQAQANLQVRANALRGSRTFNNSAVDLIAAAGNAEVGVNATTARNSASPRAPGGGAGEDNTVEGATTLFDRRLGRYGAAERNGGGVAGGRSRA